MLDLLVLCNTEAAEYRHQLLGTEQTHQIIFQRNIETGLTRISLTSGTTTQLVIDTTGLMTLGTDDLQSTGCSRFIVQLDIGTTTCHVGRDGNCTCHTGLCNDLCLQLMELRIQYLVSDTLSPKHVA